jgi:hypothetical protein
MCDDQVMVSIDSYLHVVADHAGAASARRHRATVRISERDLLIGRCQHQLLHHRQALHLAFQPDQFLLQMGRP